MISNVECPLFFSLVLGWTLLILNPIKYRPIDCRSKEDWNRGQLPIIESNPHISIRGDVLYKPEVAIIEKHQHIFRKLDTPNRDPKACPNWCLDPPTQITYWYFLVIYPTEKCFELNLRSHCVHSVCFAPSAQVKRNIAFCLRSFLLLFASWMVLDTCSNWAWEKNKTLCIRLHTLPKSLCGIITLRFPNQIEFLQQIKLLTTFQ